MLVAIYTQENEDIERIPAWIWSGHKVAYQLHFPEISKLGVISGVGHISQLFFKNTMILPIHALHVKWLPWCKNGVGWLRSQE